MKLLYGKKNRIIITALVLLVTVFVSAVISFSSETELDYVKSQVELLYDELLVQDDRLINSDTYFVTSEYISRIKPNTSIEEFTNTLNRSDFTLLEGGAEVTNGIVKTGMELVRGDEHYTLVVAGDLNKDGLMNYVDTSMMINNTKTLSDNQLIRLANDFNEDSKYDKTDVLNSVDYILDEKIELKEVNKVKTPVIDFVSGNVGDREWYLDDIKLKLTATENTEIGYKIIGSVNEMGVVEDGYEITLSGYGAYKVIAWHIGEDGNRSDTTSLVYKIDDREIIPTITYSSTEIGSERVIAAISFNKENVFITNNDGRYTHTFYGNGEFDFEFKDLTGRTGNAKAEVSWVTDSIGEDGMWRYSVLNDEEIYLREYLGGTPEFIDFIIPAEYDGYKVYGVGNNTGTSVVNCRPCGLVIEDGIKEIGASSFDNAGFEGELILSNTLEKIGSYAFSYNYFTGTLVIPDSVKEIGNNAFETIGTISALKLGSGLKSIGSEAFLYNSIGGELILPNGLESISYRAFANNNFSGDLVIPESVTNLEFGAFIYNSFDGNLTINSRINIIPSDIVAYNSFKGNLVISEGIKEIESSAFYSNSFVGDLVIPDSVESIGEYAFASNKFDGSLTLGNGLTSIPSHAFSNNRFSGNLVIPESVVSIGNLAFYSNSFVGDLIIPDSVETIDELAFSNSGFTGKLTLGRGLTSIENHVFDSCSFTGDLIIPDNIKQIGQGAFNSNNFTGSLTLNDNIDYIGPMAFATNNFTGDLVIPPKVTSVGVASFNGSGFDGKLVLNDSLKTIYTSAFNNNSFVGDLVIPNSVETIGNNAFEYAGFTGDLIIGNGVKTIEYGAFEYTDFTGNLIIGDSVTSIDQDAFYDTGFTGDFIIGDGMDNVDFVYPAGVPLQLISGEFNIGDGITEIPAGIFWDIGLKCTLVLGNNIKVLGMDSFANNPDLKGTVDASKIENFDISAFNNTGVTVINYEG